jgi:hypothetical protein
MVRGESEGSACSSTGPFLKFVVACLFCHRAVDADTLWVSTFKLVVHVVRDAGTFYQSTNKRSPVLVQLYSTGSVYEHCTEPRV